MWVASLIAGIILLPFGLIIRFLKTADLIAGINTASREERAKYDEDALCIFVGNMLISSSVLLLTAGLLTLIFQIPEYFASAAWALWVVIILGCVIYMNTGNRFRKVN